MARDDLVVVRKLSQAMTDGCSLSIDGTETVAVVNGRGTATGEAGATEKQQTNGRTRAAKT